MINKKNKFYISKKIDLIEFKKLPNFQNLPYIFGDKENFKKLFYNLNEINFPLKEIKKYTLYETGRWDLKTKNDKTIIIVSHNINNIGICDKVYKIVNGKIVKKQ